MKKTLFVLLAIVLCLGMAAIAMAGVRNTPHDPTVNPGVGAFYVCESCHIPHAGSGIYPLWNRNRDYSTFTFTTYNSPTQDEATNTTLLGYQSRLCFACHDGQISDIVTAPGNDFAAQYELQIVDPGRIISTNLQLSHPVGFNANLTQDTGGSGLNGLTYTNTYITGNQGNINFPLYPNPSTGWGPVGTGTFQCATCHAVHHTPTVSYVVGNTPGTEVYFLRQTNAASAMCAQCHPNYY